MKASVCPKYGKADIIVLKDVLKPLPKDDEIIVKVEYALVTPTDCSFRTGKPYMVRFFSGLTKPKISIHGEMYAGIVEETGKNVTEFMTGDRVYGTNGMKLGSYAEYICVKNSTVIRKIPSTVDSKQILTLLDGGITSLPYLRDKGEIKEGQKVLVIGAVGSVGSFGVILSKYFKAHVTGVASTSNISLMEELGCDEVIDYTKTDYTKSNSKYDIIFDAVGKSSFASCKSILSAEGRYMSTVPGPSAVLKGMLKIKQKGKKNLFTATGLRKAPQKHEDLSYLEGLLINQEIKPLMDKKYSLEQMIEAQKYVETGHKKGNVLIKI